MAKKAIIYNLIGNIIVYICTLLVNFTLSPYIVKVLGTDAYGYVQLANNFVSYITIATIALTSMAGRFVSLSLFKKDYEKANIYFNSIFYATLFLTVLLGVLSIGVVIFLDKLIIIPENLTWDIKLLFAFVFSAFLAGLCLTVFSVGLFVENKIYIRAKRNIESAIIRAIALFGLYFLFQPKLYYIGVLSLFVNIYMSLWNVYYTKKYCPALKLSFKICNLSCIKEIVLSGIWNSISQLSAVLNEGLDLIITNLFIGATEMGILSIAKMVPNTLLALLSNLGEPFMPKMTEAYAKNDSQEIKNIVNYGSKVIGVMMCIPIAGLIVFGDIFFKLWQPTEDEHLLHALSIISILNLILSCSTATIYGVFTIANKLKLNSIIGISTGFLNCLIVFILLKFTNLGIFAVAGVSVCTGIIRNLVFTFPYAAHCINIKWTSFYYVAFKIVGSLLVISTTFFVIRFLINPNTWISLIFVAFICCIIGLIINSIIVFDRDERTRFFKIVRNRFSR